MNKPIFLISLLTLSSCLGPIRGESVDTSGTNQTINEEKDVSVDWSHKAGQVVQGNFELKANITPHGHKIVSTQLMLNDRVITTGGEGQLELTSTLDSARDQLDDGVLKIKLVVNDVETHETTLILNNNVFSEKAFLARPLGEVKSNATTWLQSKVEKISDINRDGLEDILILDDAKAYIRLSHPEIDQNYQRVWEVADGSWDSATSCDVNGDGFTDIVLGSSFERGKIQVMFGPMLGSKQFFKTVPYLGTEKRVQLPKYFPNTNIPNTNTDQISYEGAGWRLSCSNINTIAGDEIFYSSIKSELLVPSNLKISTMFNFTSLSYLTWKNNQFELTDLGSQPQIRASSPYPAVLECSPFTRFSRAQDFNNDGYYDVFLTNVGSYTQVTPKLESKTYSVVLFGSETQVIRSNYFLSNEVEYNSNSLLPVSTQTPTIMTHRLDDINSDGYSDIGVSLLSHGNESEALGKPVATPNYIPHVIIYFGGKKFPDKTLTLMHPTNGSKKSRFGESVVSGDYNGDGFVDLAISAPGYDAVEHPTGEVIVFYGPGFSKHDIWTTPQGPERWFGQRMLALDYNRDGRDDIMASVFGSWGSSGFGNFELLFDN